MGLQAGDMGANESRGEGPSSIGQKGALCFGDTFSGVKIIICFSLSTIEVWRCVDHHHGDYQDTLSAGEWILALHHCKCLFLVKRSL